MAADHDREADDVNDFFAYRDMSDETDTTSEVARLLAEHAHPHRDQGRWWCQCGASIGQDWKQRGELVRAHQGRELAKAGLLREIAQTTAEGVGPIATDRPAP